MGCSEGLANFLLRFAVSFSSRATVDKLKRTTKVKMMLVRRTRLHSGRLRLQSVAAGMLLLFFLLEMLAVSPALHLLLHSDAAQQEHQCIIKTLAQGQIDCPLCETLAPEIAVVCEFPPQIQISKFSATLELLPPGRAPPLFPADLLSARG